MGFNGVSLLRGSLVCVAYGLLVKSIGVTVGGQMRVLGDDGSLVMLFI